MFIGMLLISLTDIYFPSIGLPLLPMAGAALFVPVSLSWPMPTDSASRARHRKTASVALLLVALYCISAIWGLLAFKSGSVKGVLGKGLGTLVLTVILQHEGNPEYRKALFKFCTRILVFHISFFLIQFLIYVITKNYVDLIQPITGVPTRHIIALSGMDLPLDRCSGLFGEPAIYSTNIYFYVTARMILAGNRLKWIDLVALATMIISASLTGVLLACLVLAVAIFRALGLSRSMLLFGIIGFVAAVGLESIGGISFVDVIVTRIAAPAADTSTRERFSDTFKTYGELPESAQIFGIGLGNVDMAVGRLINAELLPNGVIELLSYFGIVGGALVVIMFVYLLRIRRVPNLLWLIVLAMLPGGTFFTILMWWFWQGMMVLGGEELRALSTADSHASAGAASTGATS